MRWVHVAHGMFISCIPVNYYFVFCDKKKYIFLKVLSQSCLCCVHKIWRSNLLFCLIGPFFLIFAAFWSETGVFGRKLTYVLLLTTTKRKKAKNKLFLVGSAFTSLQNNNLPLSKDRSKCSKTNSWQYWGLHCKNDFQKSSTAFK